MDGRVFTPLAFVLQPLAPIMRAYFFASLVLAAAAETLTAQSGSVSSPTAAPLTKKPITLVGCVQPDAAKPEWFTLSDPKTGTSYHLTGTNVKAYVGRNVRVVGGLVPSPNIAAQAGVIDQTKAATAYEGANRAAPGKVESFEFNVARVQPMTGSCAPKTDR
jgi:hypothetical protein